MNFLVLRAWYKLIKLYVLMFAVLSAARRLLPRVCLHDTNKTMSSSSSPICNEASFFFQSKWVSISQMINAGRSLWYPCACRWRHYVIITREYRDNSICGVTWVYEAERYSLSSSAHGRHCRASNSARKTLTTPL